MRIFHRSYFLGRNLPFFFTYSSKTPWNKRAKLDSFGIGWRRWVLYYFRPGAYGSPKHRFEWCNYFGTGEGG